jgi:hypothetical protein
MSACPICGKANGACGHQPLAFPPITALNEVANVADDKKIYVPKQKVKRGVAGYRGKDVVVVDPETGKEDKAATQAANKAAK